VERTWKGVVDERGEPPDWVFNSLVSAATSLDAPQLIALREKLRQKLGREWINKLRNFPDFKTVSGGETKGQTNGGRKGPERGERWKGLGVSSALWYVLYKTWGESFSQSVVETACRVEPNASVSMATKEEVIVDKVDGLEDDVILDAMINNTERQENGNRTFGKWFSDRGDRPKYDQFRRKVGDFVKRVRGKDLLGAAKRICRLEFTKHAYASVLAPQNHCKTCLGRYTEKMVSEAHNHQFADDDSLSVLANLFSSAWRAVYLNKTPPVPRENGEQARGRFLDRLTLILKQEMEQAVCAATSNRVKRLEDVNEHKNHQSITPADEPADDIPMKRYVQPWKGPSDEEKRAAAIKAVQDKVKQLVGSSAKYGVRGCTKNTYKEDCKKCFGDKTALFSTWWTRSLGGSRQSLLGTVQDMQQLLPKADQSADIEDYGKIVGVRVTDSGRRQEIIWREEYKCDRLPLKQNPAQAGTQSRQKNHNPRAPATRQVNRPKGPS